MGNYPHVFDFPYSAIADRVEQNSVHESDTHGSFRFESVQQDPAAEPCATNSQTVAVLPLNKPFPLRGHWNEDFFGNENPIVIELGCGRGEYTIELAKKYPNKNFIGVDIKGARMWTGATEALQSGMKNVAFLRTNIEIIDYFFGAEEVSELWITFPDPQMKKPTKRLTSTFFLRRYANFLRLDGLIHLKTDSLFLHTYTYALVNMNNLPLQTSTTDLYSMAELYTPELRDMLTTIQTYYEQQWLKRGLSIKYLSFGLPPAIDIASRVESMKSMKETEMEIELDAYRSYNRGKRSGLDKHQ